MGQRELEKSIIPNNDKYCYLCKQRGLYIEGTDSHHCLFGNKKKYADDDGLTVQLCHRHHMRLHSQQEHQIELKQLAERVWLEHYDKTIEDWINRYGKNFL